MQSDATSAPGGVFVPRCVKCNRSIGASDHVIQGGRDFHRSCLFANAPGPVMTSEIRPASAPAPVVRSVAAPKQNVAQCPGCKQYIGPNLELVIVSGTEWHRSCYSKTGALTSVASAPPPNISYVETCPLCNKPVNPNHPDQIVVSAKKHHRSCYERTGALTTPEPKRNELRNDELCPGCKKDSNNGLVLIFVRGHAWHRTCFEATGGLASEPKRTPQPAVSYTDTCPDCGKEVPSWTPDQVVLSGGVKYHRSCAERSGKVKKLDEPEQRGTHISYEDTCATCHKKIEWGQEKLVKSCVPHHRACVIRE